MVKHLVKNDGCRFSRYPPQSPTSPALFEEANVANGMVNIQEDTKILIQF